jgi:predicted amidophosphoribosyltransferase
VSAETKPCENCGRPFRGVEQICRECWRSAKRADSKHAVVSRRDAEAINQLVERVEALCEQQEAARIEQLVERVDRLCEMVRVVVRLPGVRRID